MMYELGIHLSRKCAGKCAGIEGKLCCYASEEKSLEFGTL